MRGDRSRQSVPRRRPETKETGPTPGDVAGNRATFPLAPPFLSAGLKWSSSHALSAVGAWKTGSAEPRTAEDGLGTPHSNSQLGDLVGSWDSPQPTRARLRTPCYRSWPIEVRFIPRVSHPLPPSPPSPSPPLPANGGEKL